MQKDTLESLLNQAKEEEKRYEWLHATDYYKKASDWMVEAQDFLKAAKVYERVAYSFYRAAFQAGSYREFKNRLELSAEAYQSIFELLEKVKSEEAQLNHAKAMVAWTNSIVESDFVRMTALVDKWWNLENKALDIYQDKSDLLAIGKTCNNLLEGSIYNRLGLSAKEFVERALVGANLGERAIQVLLKTNNNYELAKAYYLTARHYGIISYYYIIRPGDQTSNLRALFQAFARKWRLYSDKALSLSEKIGDSWLIGGAHDTKVFGMNQQIQPDVLQYHAKKVVKYGELARDNYLLSKGCWESSMLTVIFADLEEDPEKRRLKLKEALKWGEKALHYSKIIAFLAGILMSQQYHAGNLCALASLGLSLKDKRKLLKRAVKIGRESLEYVLLPLNQGQILLEFFSPMFTLSRTLFLLSQTESRLKEKRRLLEEAINILEEAVSVQLRVGQSVSIRDVFTHTTLAVAQSELAKISTSTKKKIELFNKAVLSFEKGLENFRKHNELGLSPLKGQAIHYGRLQVDFAEVLIQFYAVKEEKQLLDRAIEVYTQAGNRFQKAELPTYSAEINWSIAKLHEKMGDHLEAAENYEKAAMEYEKAAEKVPRLKDFYHDHTLYMSAWSRIEKARSCHLTEQYNKARNHYRAAAKLHESTERWNYLANNYFAWANMEKAEELSRKESTQQAKEAFKKTQYQFIKAEKSIKEGIGKNTLQEEELTRTLLQAINLRRKFCHARIQIEEAKLLDRRGRNLQSSKSYAEAGKEIESILRRVEVEAERGELELIGILCEAWGKMAFAEGKKSPELFLEAAELFEQAKNLSPTEKTSLWALGNSSFCRGLAAGIEYQRSLDLKDNALAKGHLKSAATSYFQAGFESAAEYAKATQRLFDAYIFMNQAECEVDPGKRAKKYQMAENLLQIAAGSFTKSKQPEKAAQVQGILAGVREEKALAVSLSQVMEAPSIASSTLSFAAPSPTSEVSVGLEEFQHANVQANIIAGLKEVKVGESFCLTVEFVNAGKEPALLTRVEDFVPPDFIVVQKPEIYRLEDACLNMKGKQIAPLKLVEAKLVLQPSKKGIYKLRPTVHYLDEVGHSKSLQLKSVEIKVEEVILADRISTGTRELDSLLLGGIPKEYSVVLTGPPSDERELIIKNFLEAGTKEGQTSFYVATESEGIENLLEKPSFYLFLCNPKPKAEVPDLPNVYKLHGKTDLTNLNIALLKAYRNVEQSQNKRICINMVSDVLVDYGVKATRKWIAELTTDLVSKNFTVLAVMNPAMHPPDQATGIIDLFDGEISLYQAEDPLECRKSLKIKKLRNQDYIKNPICLA